MHVFLTGGLQTGKSTAIHRFLAREGIAPGGFRTRWDRPAGRLELTVLRAGAPRAVLTVARAGAGGTRADPDAFDTAAALLLEGDSPAPPLLLMDELGFLERCSPRFQQAVLTLLDAPVPVLGVLRAREDGPFWAPLHRRGDVTLLELTLDNREQMPGRLAALLARNGRERRSSP